MQESEPARSPAPPPLPAENPLVPVYQPPALTTTSGIAEEDRSLAMLCHLLGIFTGFLGPLILWLVKKDSSAFISHHGREALNFQLTILLATLCLGSVTFLLMFVLIGFLLVPLLVVIPIFALVAEILAAVAAQKGEWHRYPCCIRMIR